MMHQIEWDVIGPTGSGRKVLQHSNFPLTCSSCKQPITPGQVFIDNHHETCVWLDADFLDQLIKRSPEAEDILRDCGRIRLMRAALAAVKMYLEISAGRTQEGGL